MTTPEHNPTDRTKRDTAFTDLQPVDPTIAEPLRALTARELFIAEFNIEPLGEHSVSLVIPAGTSLLSFIERAEEIVKATDPHDSVVFDQQLDMWREFPPMQVPLTEPRRIAINGHVEQTAGLAAREREIILQELGLVLPKLEELAVAYIGFYMATGKNLLCRHEADTTEGGLFVWSGHELTESMLMGCVASHYPIASAARLD